ncbi:MAG: response regulator [Gemmatimonadales bacterium]|nr:MAG: response regulator [Gemmatimonadales bacterium]
MAGPRELTESPPAPVPSALNRGRRAGDTGPGAGPALYLVVTVALVTFALLLPPSGTVRGGALLLLLALETTATALALVLGALALVRFYSRRRRTYLFVGTGFVITGVLDALHLASFPLWNLGAAPWALGNLLDWSWLLSRGFLAVYLYVALQGSRGPAPPFPRLERARSVYLVGGLSSVLALVLFSVLPGGPLQGPSFLPRPLEAIPAAFFGLTAWGYLARGNWHKDVFERWFILGLLISVVLHLFFTARAPLDYGSLYTAGHALKLLSYAAILVGVLMGVHITFRREERALEAVQQMNRALEREVAVRREAEGVLQRSEERLQNFLDTANDLIQSTAPDGRILYVNPAWERTVGYTRAELDALTLADLVHPSNREAVLQSYTRILTQGSAPKLEVQFLTRDGRTVTCSGSATRHVVDGEAVAVQAIFRDVSEQRRAERELAESRASLEAVVESTGDSIWSVDNKMRLVTFNTAFALALEARSGREASPGDLPEDLFDARDAVWHRELYARGLRGERFSELHEEVVAGRPRLFEIFCHPITGEEGISGAVMFGKDVTRRIRAEEALRMAKDEAEGANRAKSQFLANMSHELRTPLNSVIGFANVLRKNKRGNLTEKDLGFLERILANGRHLLSLINEVLDLAKIEAGRMDLEIGEVALDDLVRETVQQLEGQARERRVALGWSFPPQLAPVETDRAKLKQVVINLVGNALKFSGGGSVTVILEADPARKATALSVRDTGIGIPPERLEAIFEAFQQADGSTTRHYGGTGLGLAISRSICQLLGYELEVESKVGVGSNFTIRMEGGVPPSRVEEGRIPRAHRDEREGEATAAEALGKDGIAQNLKVLVVDDGADSRALMAHHLREFGCRVFTAAGGEEGIELARRESPDLITLDLVMPGSSGLDTLQRLKEDARTRSIPLVVVSAAASQDRGRLLGALDVLTKPVEREDLLRVLWRTVLRRRGGRVLVVEDGEEARLALTALLEGLGLLVAAAPDGREALRMVEEDAPDVVLVDLGLPVMDGLTFLDHLRQNPYHSGLPVVVLSDRDVSPPEQAVLDRTASAVIATGPDRDERIRDVLGRILPLAEA